LASGHLNGTARVQKISYLSEGGVSLDSALIAVFHDVVADYAAILTEWSRLAMSSKGAQLYEA